MFGIDNKSIKEETEVQTKMQEPRIESYLAEDIRIEGNVETDKSLRLDGTVIGDVKISNCLVIGPKGYIEGNINVGEIDVHGKVCGNIFCDRHIAIFTSGTVDGDIETSSLNIEEGGELNGKCSMKKSEKNKFIDENFISELKKEK